MPTTQKRTLLRLGDSGLVMENPGADIRGFKVRDRDDNDIGSIDELIIDDTEKKIRFLEVASGGFLGMGESKVMIPIDAVTQITEDTVHIDRTRDHVANSPAYQPDLTSENDLEPIYAHYGYVPYWGAGYAYPAFPFYPR